MLEFQKPVAIDQEIILNPTKVIMSKTDKEGVLEFANDYFVEVSGYEEYELMGKSIYCTQHPDMPEVIFKMMWEKIENKKNFHLLIKNLAKNGKYYWAVSDFAYKTDEDTGELVAIYNRRKSASRSAVLFFDKLYKKLKNIEKESGIGLSEKYLLGHLEEIGKTFDELLVEHTNFDIEKSSPAISIMPKTQPTSLNNQNNEQVIPKTSTTINKQVQKINDLQKEAEKAINKTAALDTNKPGKKKGFFQKMFGKTDEEIAAENKKKS